MCDYLWHCLTCASRLSFFSLSLLSPYVSLSLSFCLTLIKKPNHADSSEQITSHSLWMFEDDGATGATNEEIHADRSRSWILKPTQYFKSDFCICIFFSAFLSVCVFHEYRHIICNVTIAIFLNFYISKVVFLCPKLTFHTSGFIVVYTVPMQ